MSTRETGISGSVIRERASQTRFSRAAVTRGNLRAVPVARHAEQGRLAALDHLGVPLVHGAARAPALPHLIPADGLVEEPALGHGVELAGELVLQHPLARLLVEMRGNGYPDLGAERNHGRHPRLAQLVVRLALEPVLQLPGVMLELVRQPEPLDSGREHPVDGPLEHLLDLAARLREAPHPRLAMPEVEVLLLVDLDERPLEWPVRGVLMHIGEEHDAGDRKSTRLN